SIDVVRRFAAHTPTIHIDGIFVCPSQQLLIVCPLPRCSQFPCANSPKRSLNASKDDLSSIEGAWVIRIVFALVAAVWGSGAVRVGQQWRLAYWIRTLRG